MQKAEDFLKDYRRVRDDVIRPTLEAVGQQLREQGHNYEIIDGPMPVRNSLLQPRSTENISLRVFVKEADWNRIGMFDLLNKVPFVSFGALLLERRVEAFICPESEGRYGQWRPRAIDTFTLEQVTKDVIERQVAQFFREMPL
ncbi:MAG TPA: hypothetical protein VN228_19665 [Pyrinomonadaceae bacterium]|nr:hypothetical protein [Pyrinomonadaceae bacterium]